MTRFPRLCVLGAAAVVVAILCMSADGQPPRGAKQRPGGPGFGRGPGMMGFGGQSLLGLCRSETAREYAKVSSQEADEVAKLAEKVSAERRERFGQQFSGFRELTDEQRQARMEEMRKEGEKRNKEVKAQLVKILGEEKVALLARIQRQMQGPRVLLDRGFQEEVGISGPLAERLQSITESAMEKRREEMRGLFGGGGRPSEADREKIRARFEAAEKEFGKELMGALPDEVKEKVKQALGKPVPVLDKIREELRASMRGPGGGPGGRRGGEGRQGGEGRRGGSGGRRPGGQGRRGGA